MGRLIMEIYFGLIIIIVVVVYGYQIANYC